MKKVLLSVAAIFAAMSLNAQEVCTFNVDNALELDSENGTALTAGTVLGQTESIVATIGADDTYKPQSATFTVNGTDITGGLQGATNPKDADGGVPATTLVAPASGAFLQFEAKADGFLYVMHKASSNKAYTVFEEGTPISYTYAAIGDEASLLGGVYSYTLPYEVENEQFVVKESVGWAEQEYLKVANPDAYAANWKEETADDGTTKKTWDPAIKINGLGVLKFPVYKDCKYLVNANGSKITAIGFAFSTEDNVLIQSGDVVIYKGESAAEPVKKVYSVIGTLVGNWDVDTDMELVNGLYTATIDNVAAGSYKWKIRQDHAWTINWGDAEDGTNIGVQDGKDYVAEMPEGGSITITFNPATAEINAYVVGGAIEPAGEAVLAEVDFTTLTEFTGWNQFADGQEGSVELTAEGLAITVGTQTGELWQPQTMVIGDGSFNLAEDGNYKVVITAKYPTDGTLQINMGSWGSNAQQTFEVTSTGDFQTDEFVFDPWGADIEGCHLLFQNGDFLGTTIIKSIKLIDLDGADAIKSVKAAKEDGAIYNLAGQKVSASYKGVVIKNGKKYIQ